MPRPTRRPASIAMALALIGLAGEQHLPAGSGPAPDVTGRAAAGWVASLPVVRAHHYTMAGRIRPLLFWIGKDDVGSGEIVWRSDGEGTRAWELLIGSDPATAPRKLNRWGYIVEAVQRGQARVVGLMSTSEEASLSDVEQDLSATSPHSRFKTIAATVTRGSSHTVTGTIDAGRDVTLHDAAELVTTAQQRMAGLAPRVAAIPPHVRPGFLSTVAELIDLTLAAAPNGRRALDVLAGQRVAYAYGVKTFDLVLTSVSVQRGARHDGRAQPLRSSFEIRPHGGGDRYRFDLEYAAAGELAGVPSRIRYQPRWWLQLELTLDEP